MMADFKPTAADLERERELDRIATALANNIARLLSVHRPDVDYVLILTDSNASENYQYSTMATQMDTQDISLLLDQLQQRVRRSMT